MPVFTIRHLLLKELGHLANKRSQVIGGHFWCEPLRENESRTVIGLFRERNVCRFEAAVWDGEHYVTPARAAVKETRCLMAESIQVNHVSYQIHCYSIKEIQ